MTNYASGYRAGARDALDAAARRADELGRPLTADELRKVGSEFAYLTNPGIRRSARGAA